MNILGVRTDHDSSACLMQNGKIIADIAEERLSRSKNDSSFPIRAIEHCLNVGNIDSLDIDILAIPSLKFESEFKIFFDIPEEILPAEKNSFIKNLYYSIKNYKPPVSTTVLPRYQKRFKLKKDCKIILIDHHLCHISSAAFTSGINIENPVLGFTMDGIGDGTSAAVWKIQNNKIENLYRVGGEGSLGWYYSNATEGMGWRHGSDEWKLMGLAPYGKSENKLPKDLCPKYKDGKLVVGYNFDEHGVWHDHGSNHYHGKVSDTFAEYYAKMRPENYACEVQTNVENEAFNFIIPWIEKEKIFDIVCAGGFFLNVKFNQNLWYKKIIKSQYVFPNPGDAGLSLGACLYAHYNESKIQHKPLKSLYFGSEFSNDKIHQILTDRGIDFEFFDNIEEVTASYLYKNLVIGWFQGRMESGPRALGNRSILMSPLEASNKDLINSKVKYREAFRPFCPSIKEERYHEYIKDGREERFMVSSFLVNNGIAQRIPAVVHSDGSARPQMVTKFENARYHKLISEFEKLSGESVLLNTSFNVKGEPIVCNPREAIKCFYDTGIDILVLGNYLIKKTGL